MQLPELFRRGVVRPLDSDAQHQLSRFYVEQPIRVEWLSIPADGSFDLFWSSGVFQQINNVCGTTISDYEEEVLSTNSTQKAIEAIRQTQRHVSDEAVSMFLRQLDALLSEALLKQQDVYFIF